jgi:hypothetical protein
MLEVWPIPLCDSDLRVNDHQLEFHQLMNEFNYTPTNDTNERSPKSFELYRPIPIRANDHPITSQMQEYVYQHVTFLEFIADQDLYKMRVNVDQEFGKKKRKRKY